VRVVASGDTDHCQPVTSLHGTYTPQRQDLRRDARYTLHCSVNDSKPGGEIEFYVGGDAEHLPMTLMREEAVRRASS